MCVPPTKNTYVVPRLINGTLLHLRIHLSGIHRDNLLGYFILPDEKGWVHRAPF
jgi:hypothetical protein